MGYRTPSIDRIAADGMQFTDSYGEQSCTAGRASFITGQSVYRTGLSKVGMPGADVGLQAEDPTIAELLKPLSYATGQFGKNHLGDRPGRPLAVPLPRHDHHHDKVVGALLDKLDALGIAGNTIVVYPTDNGPHMNNWLGWGDDAVPQRERHQLQIRGCSAYQDRPRCIPPLSAR